MKLPKSIAVTIGLPGFGSIEGTWEPDDAERDAAWELYIELVTRISIADITKSNYLLRESLDSLHELFAITRSILRKYGPSVARPKSEHSLTFGYLAVAILNSILRPFLSRWHPLLLDHEGLKPVSVSSLKHERDWEYYFDFCNELERVQDSIYEYGNVLAEVAGVDKLSFKTNITLDG